jgi:arginine utilization protein RocB
MGLMAEKVKKLTLDLVQIPSITESPGENAVVEYLAEYMGQWEYFRANPGQLRIETIVGDEAGRQNLVAVVKGAAGNRRTAVFLGHIDTVGIDDYGDLQQYAFDPARLAVELAKKELDSDCLADLASGEWLFGRGVFDMKSGVAAQVVLMEDLCRHPESLPGNIVFLAVPDEENNSAGMLAAVEILNDLAEREGFDYLAAIDSDYTAPRWPGDDNKYVYIGTVGKLLPTFYIAGKETHVGQSFEGLDPNHLAAELTRLVNLSMDLCDGAEGEYPSPPVTLRQKDLKTQYSVQTASATLVYYNYPTHQSDPETVLAALRGKAERAFQNVIDYLNGEYTAFCQASGAPVQKLPWEPRVLSFAELYAEVDAALGGTLAERLAGLQAELLQDKSLDGRDFSLRLVEEVYKYTPRKQPTIVILFAPPYYPHIYVKGDSPREKHLLDSIDRAIAGVEKQTTHKIIRKKFYPYISDLSYFSVGDSGGALDSLLANMPAWGEKYSLPLEAIQRLNLPVVNIGPFGKDAHKFTERLLAEYAFAVVPELLRQTLTYLLAEAE